MKAFIGLVLIVVCNIVANQAAAIDAQDEGAWQILPNYVEGEVLSSDAEHSRQRRQSNQASVDIQNQRRGGTSVNAQVGRVWESRDKNTRVEANVNWGRNFGPGGGRPNYGGNIQFSRRF